MYVSAQEICRVLDVDADGASRARFSTARRREARLAFLHPPPWTSTATSATIKTAS